MIERGRANIIFNKADFAVISGDAGEKLNAVRNKIFRTQPIDENIDMLLQPFRINALITTSYKRFSCK